MKHSARRSARRSHFTLSTLAILCAAAFAAACAASVPMPTDNELTVGRRQWPQLTLADLSRGRDAYLDHCVSCHAPHAPHEFPAERWPAIVGEMRVNAHLSATDEEDIVRYLVAGASQQTPLTHAQRGSP